MCLTHWHHCLARTPHHPYPRQVIWVPPHEQAAPVGTPLTPGSPMGFATPPQVGTTRPRPDSNKLPSGEHTRARLLSPLEPMMQASGCIITEEVAQTGGEPGGGGDGGGDGGGGDGGGDGGGGKGGAPGDVPSMPADDVPSLPLTDSHTPASRC